MLKPNDPLRLTIPVNTSTSLKNDRSLIMVNQRVHNHWKKVPKLVVGTTTTKVMNAMKAAITRQLEAVSNNEWNGPIDDQGFAMVSLIHVYYKSRFPKSDIDNFHTTFQECLQERLMADDRQIEYFTPVRLRVLKSEHEYIDSFIWTTEGGIHWLDEQQAFLDYYKGLTDESRRFESVPGRTGTDLQLPDTTEVVSWF